MNTSPKPATKLHSVKRNLQRPFVTPAQRYGMTAPPLDVNATMRKVDRELQRLLGKK